MIVFSLTAMSNDQASGAWKNLSLGQRSMLLRLRCLNTAQAGRSVRVPRPAGP